MSVHDLINGGFEIGASIMILVNCRALYLHKELKGVSPIAIIFFFLWGIWNIIWFTHLDQPISFYGGILALTANIIYIGMLAYYKRCECLKNINAQDAHQDCFDWDIITVKELITLGDTKK